MGLLYFATQFGIKISKLSFIELEYFLAKIVNGHCHLKNSNTIDSNAIQLIPIQT